LALARKHHAQGQRASRKWLARCTTRADVDCRQQRELIERRPGIQTMLESLFGTQLARPTNGVDMLYVVILPPDIQSAGNNDDAPGCRGSGVWECNLHATYNGASYNYAWLRHNTETLETDGSLTQQFTRKVAEAISDPGAVWSISGSGQVADATRH
jgi:hypothetical protein